MGYVQVVGKQQLKRVLPRGKIQLGLGPAVAEMDVLSVRRHWHA